MSPRVDPKERVDPVGIVEVIDRLGVTRKAYEQWQARYGPDTATPFPEPRWTVGGRPAWDWSDIERWAIDTGRLPDPKAKGKTS